MLAILADMSSYAEALKCASAAVVFRSPYQLCFSCLLQQPALHRILFTDTSPYGDAPQACAAIAFDDPCQLLQLLATWLCSTRFHTH